MNSASSEISKGGARYMAERKAARSLLIAQRAGTRKEALLQHFSRLK